MKWGGVETSVLPNWEMTWSSVAVPDITGELNIKADWHRVAGYAHKLMVPEGRSAMWVRLSLPEHGDHYAVLIEQIFGQEFKAFQDNVLIYSAQGTDSIQGNKILIPLMKSGAHSELYIWSRSGSRPAGIEGSITAGDYDSLLSEYVRQDFMDVILGASLIFMSAVLALCAVIMKNKLFTTGSYLVLIILSSGVLMLTSSSFLPLVLDVSGRWMENLFDVALFTMLLSFTLFFEDMIGRKKSSIVSNVRRVLLGYTAVCFCIGVLNLCLSYRLDGLYEWMTMDAAEVLVVLLFLFLLIMALRQAVQGSVKAYIFASGLTVFNTLSLLEFILFHGTRWRNELHWWKWGIVVLILTLIIIMARDFVKNHKKVVRYSQELEKFNNDVQRSERMGIISELAASVAHEVRNPLQVTRGFLQILGERSAPKEKEYLSIAVTELDRASTIITDFLTFAKPEMEKVELVNVSDELRHVAGVLVPLANLQNAEIILSLQDGLQAQGNSSKLKQAFINIIKNSIESLRENGLITITLWKSGSNMLISIADNGEGMKSSELARLGEPYYSNKTKGTGLGLMVTFRIIEAMGGVIQFYSQPDEGTEVVIKLPLAGTDSLGIFI